MIASRMLHIPHIESPGHEVKTISPALSTTVYSIEIENKITPESMSVPVVHMSFNKNNVCAHLPKTTFWIRGADP